MGGQQASPSLKLFLKRLGRSFIYRILPVPVVFLLTAFWLQLTTHQERPCSAFEQATKLEVMVATSPDTQPPVERTPTGRYPQQEGRSVAHICGFSLLGIHKKSMCSSGCGTIACRSVCRVCVFCCGVYLHQHRLSTDASHSTATGKKSPSRLQTKLTERSRSLSLLSHCASMNSHRAHTAL